MAAQGLSEKAGISGDSYPTLTVSNRDSLNPRYVNMFQASSLFLLLFNHIKANPENVPHGREGYYFATGGEFSMHEYVSAIGEIMTKHGRVESSKPQTFTEEIDRYFSVCVPSIPAETSLSIVSLA